MRGSDGRSGSLFSYVDLEARVRSDHPLRPIREIANAALADLTGEFAALYPARAMLCVITALVPLIAIASLLGAGRQSHS